MNNIAFYVPGSRYYDNGVFTNQERSFANISITGTICQCHCEHCQGQLLQNMLPATTPEALVHLAAALRKRGCGGVLVSGGAGHDGSVPLAPFGEALTELVNMGLTVVVHPGLLTTEMADILAKAKVARVALDLIGDQDTIHSVYHLKRTPEDYRNSLRLARFAGLQVSPHIVVGLHNGEIRGEYAALDMVAKEGASSLVFVILNPLHGTNMGEVTPPNPVDVGLLFSTARILLPSLPLALGCVRPPGIYARKIEQLALEAQFNAIAFPARETVNYVQALGYNVTYQETCCGILPALD